MKRKNIRILQTIALAAGLAASASTVSAAGLLGERYVKATLDGVFWDDDSGLDDGFGASLTYNQPLAKAFDLSLGYSHLRSDLPDLDDGEGGEIDGGSLSGDLFAFSGTWFAPAANGKLYARGSLGWATTNADIGDDDAWVWALETGLEIPVGQQASVTPYISYSDSFESGSNGTFDFGVIGELDLNNRTGLVLGVSINDDSDWEVNGGVLFRF